MDQVRAEAERQEDSIARGPRSPGLGQRCASLVDVNVPGLGGAGSGVTASEQEVPTPTRQCGLPGAGAAPGRVGESTLVASQPTQEGSVSGPGSSGDLAQALVSRAPQRSVGADWKGPLGALLSKTHQKTG